MLIGALKDWFFTFGESNPRRFAFAALAAAISLALVSIAASQILLAAAIVGAVWIWKKEGRAFLRLPPFTWPLFCFMAWTVAAVLASHNVPLGLRETKKFFLYSILFLVPWIARSEDALLRIYRAIFLVSAVAAASGVVQFIQNPNRDLLHRISGFMSNWMTYSGLLMLALVAVLAYVVCRPLRKNWWALPLGVLMAAGVYLSKTRSTQSGALVGLAMVLLLRRPRASLVLAALVALLYIGSPEMIKQRYRAGLDPNDPNTANRIELFHTSIRLIRDNPWLGVGPKNVNQEALRYRGKNGFPNWMYQHMHNNFTQIAAERGIPGLLLWLWLMGRLAWDALRVYRSARKNTPRSDGALVISTAALGVWAALLAAGMFEWNFGDSEPLTLFLFMAAAPYAITVAAAKPKTAAIAEGLKKQTGSQD